MAELAKEISLINIEEELKQSYLDYAMSVIVGRALPDVRDGLKPVHRRALYAMHQLNNDWNKPYKKSARVVGDVIGKYHPHGDSAVYDTIVRMAQPFSLRYMLVDGQGNFGSVDGDSPAAMRYTEIRMSKVAHALLTDLEKDTVDFAPNYDESEMMPTVLPARIPNLLVNGSSGIAVGMATNIPPHNINEVIQACLALLDNPNLTVEDLMVHIPGPDFPTAGIINGRAGIVSAYKTGRGRLLVRAKTSIDTNEKNQKQSIIVHELPYQVNKARLIEKIAELVKLKKLDGIVGLRDESDKEGMRIVIDLRRGESADVVLNNLFAQTQLQNTFGINIVALVDGRPQLVNLKCLLSSFLKHRREVITRRTVFELKKARARTHILEGLAIALANLDPVIALIKSSSSPKVAKAALLERTWAPGSVMGFLDKTSLTLTRPETLASIYGLVDNEYRLSPEQAQAILELRLHRLTGLEQDKIIEEYQALVKTIQDLLDILSDPEVLRSVIQKELEEVKSEFGDERRTVILSSQQDLEVEDLIQEEAVVVTLSRTGYIKTQPLSGYQSQRRGGKGKSATSVKEEDEITALLVANSRDTLLCFSSIGKVYWLKVFQLPQVGRGARGKPIVNLLPLQTGETVTSLLPLNSQSQSQYIVMATAQGLIKKTALDQYSRPRQSGIKAIDLSDNDQLVGVDFTPGDSDILLFANTGKSIKFNESQVREVGRTARGVRGIRLGDGHSVISMVVVRENSDILIVTENGYGKRTRIEDFPLQGRGGQGVKGIIVNERNGDVVSAIDVVESDDCILISDKGTLVRLRVNEVSVIGRNTQGVRMIDLNSSESLVRVDKVFEVSGGIENTED